LLLILLCVATPAAMLACPAGLLLILLISRGEFEPIFVGFVIASISGWVLYQRLCLAQQVTAVREFKKV